MTPIPTDKIYRIVRISPSTMHQSSKDMVQLVRDRFIYDITNYLHIGYSPITLNKFITTCRGDNRRIRSSLNTRIYAKKFPRLAWKSSAALDNDLVYNYNDDIQTFLKAAYYPTYAVVNFYVCRAVSLQHLKFSYSNLLCTISVYPDEIYYTNEVSSVYTTPSIVGELSRYIRNYLCNFPEGIQNEVIVKTVPYE